MPQKKITEAVKRVQLDFPQIYYACHSRHRQRHSTTHDLTDRDVLYLGHLRVGAGVHPRDLARHLGLSPSTLSAFLQRMQRLGYIDRRVCPDDRRHVELFLTNAGRRVLCESSVLEADRVGSVLVQMSAGDREQAVEGLRLLADACRTARLEYGNRASDSSGSDTFDSDQP